MDRGRPNPWRRLGSREVYRNPWIRVREDRVLRPDGAEGLYGVVEFPPALAIVALTEDEAVYLVGQYRYATDRYSWEVPTGGGSPDESPLVGARRELLEETGLTATRWTPLGELQVSNSVTDQLGHVYLAQGLTAGSAAPDDTEQLEVRRMPLAEAVRLARQGRISQAFSVVALYQAWFHLRGVPALSPDRETGADW